MQTVFCLKWLSKGFFPPTTNFGGLESPSISELVSAWQCEVVPALSVMSLARVQGLCKGSPELARSLTGLRHGDSSQSTSLH